MIGLNYGARTATVSAAGTIDRATMICGARDILGALVRQFA